MLDRVFAGLIWLAILAAVVWAASLLTGCDEKAGDPTIEKARTAILKRAIKDRDVAEKRADANERRILQLEAQISILENRLKIANDSAELSKRLLDESNLRKLEKAKQILREIQGN